ncbi:MmyB family transcriptional regulator [Streptomyces buecherae]|uniref:MmyB family transcriptional regulator n=1 Tax=Streptomyces buecherae TaxID=2763006 RepID=UPI002F962030
MWRTGSRSLLRRSPYSAPKPDAISRSTARRCRGKLALHCTEFTAWWYDHRVLRRTRGTKPYRHPVVGHLPSHASPSKPPAIQTKPCASTTRSPARSQPKPCAC